MPGADRYVDGWGTVITCYWQDGPAELPQPILVAAWLAEIRYQYPNFRQGLKAIEIWSAKRSDIGSSRDGGRIVTAAGLCWPDGVILINGMYANPGCLSHEVGHWNDYGLFSSGDEHARRLLALWDDVRGWEATGPTPVAERWAEDFRALFGCAGVRGTTSPGDDGRRKPWDVPALKFLMLAIPRVLDHWRRVGWISNATVNEADGSVQWLRTMWWFWKRWERFRAGHFEQHDGARWVPFTP